MCPCSAETPAIEETRVSIRKSAAAVSSHSQSLRWALPSHPPKTSTHDPRATLQAPRRARESDGPLWSSEVGREARESRNGEGEEGDQRGGEAERQKKSRGRVRARDGKRGRQAALWKARSSRHALVGAGGHESGGGARRNRGVSANGHWRIAARERDRGREGGKEGGRGRGLGRSRKRGINRQRVNICRICFRVSRMHTLLSIALPPALSLTAPTARCECRSIPPTPAAATRSTCESGLHVRAVTP